MENIYTRKGKEYSNIYIQDIMNTINDEKKHFNNNNENENIENSIILNINSIEVDKKLNSTSIKGSNYLEKNDNTESINDKNDYNKSESPILLSVGDYSENIKNPPLISYQACSENSKDQIIENSVRLNLNDANKYEENYNNNLSLKLNPFNKIHSIDELVIRNENVAKKKFNGLDSSYKYSNWEIKNGDFNDSQNSIKASTSALKNKMSGSYIRLKLDDKDVDSFKNKNNLFNIYINSNDSDDSLNESNKSDNNSLNIQRSFSKYRKSRTSSILITGIKSGSSPGTSVATTSNSHELTIPVLNQDSFPVLTPENNSNSSEKLNESQKNSDEAKSTHSELIENQLNLLDSMSTIRINDNEINNNNDNSYNISQNNIDSVNSSRIKLSSGSIEDKNLEYDEAEQINLANINANKNRNIAVKDEMTKVMDNEKHDDKEWKDTSSEHFE
ncbi:hypothetical protein BCR36DRAFT_373661 [Piromyces finnis]|uniref:Uncharacterized protein n=1 Tax=Piromyces finnis TaxID=1754191 RepID=A0A1Y1V092_9FUNG|nr:hypothetical protein BCR36DRAFT_373661 [Piromyces finnis]|eukprot:ORX43760.1 hypothetical protein BCR36DRAFT_373661 [Piromyces finnis]